MDRSKIHIAMVDCPEIQEHKIGDRYCPDHERFYGWNSEIEDFICARNPDSPWSEEFHDIHGSGGFGRCVYVPHQDQYWDMVADAMKCIHERGYWCQDCHEEVGKFMREDHPSILNLLLKNNHLTRETVLCAFFMRNKTWDGEKWIKS